MTILYFISTGNSLYVAKKIGGKLYSIPQAVKNKNYHFDDDKIGFVFPDYGLCLPPYIREFLSKVTIKCDYLFAIITYGVYKGAIVSDLLDAPSWLNFDYINTIKMTENFLPMFEMKEQINKTSNTDIEDKLYKIITDISQHKHSIPHDSFFNRFLTWSHKKRYPYHPGVGITQHFRIDPTCCGCGTCTQVCPVDNIKLPKSKPIFFTHCISCLACTQNCPQNAIRLTNEKSKERFRNSNINLDDIISSNK